jgi:hypothetical protein
MNRIGRVFETCRLGVQTQLGRSALLYPLLHRLRGAPRSRTLVGDETELCIEAPSGSGNSYFVNGFRMINPEVRVAHHHHVAAQLERSVARGVPTLVILRNPLDCVASRSQDAPWLTGPVFSQWIRFFEAAEVLRAAILLLPFEFVTRDPAGAVERINERFESHFDSRFPDPAQIFTQMDAVYTEARAKRLRSPNRPDPTRAEARTRARQVAELHPLAPAATALYDRLRSSAQ